MTHPSSDLEAKTVTAPTWPGPRISFWEDQQTTRSYTRLCGSAGPLWCCSTIPSFLDTGSSGSQCDLESRYSSAARCVSQAGVLVSEPRSLMVLDLPVFGFHHPDTSSRVPLDMATIESAVLDVMYRGLPQSLQNRLVRTFPESWLLSS